MSSAWFEVQADGGKWRDIHVFAIVYCFCGYLWLGEVVGRVPRKLVLLALTQYPVYLAKTQKQRKLGIHVMTTSEVFPSHMAQGETSLVSALAQRRSPLERGCSVIRYMFAHNHLSFWSNQELWWMFRWFLVRRVVAFVVYCVTQLHLVCLLQCSSLCRSFVSRRV